MKKIILILIGLLLITACGRNDSNEYDPHQGTEGLVIEFLPNTPPDEVYENSPFSIGFEAHNAGATDIDKAKIVLSTQRSLFESFEDLYYARLEGKSINNPYGDSDIKVIDIQTKTIFAAETQPAEFKIVYCYPYSTVFSTNVCIDPDVLGEKTNKPAECPEQKRTFRNGQGAPVAVISMETKMLPTKTGAIPTFEFEVENVGKGTVMAKTAYENACSSTGLKPAEVGLIDASNIYLGFDKLKCTRNQLRVEQRSEGDEYFDVEVTTLACEGNEIPYSEEAYLGSITMTLDYGYKDETSTDMFIVNNPAR